jgi:hypothetical protein
MADMNSEEIKDQMRLFAMLRANVENWKYVEANKHLLPREKLEQTIEQMTSTIDELVENAQTFLEIEALTKFDPIDLL